MNPQPNTKYRQDYLRLKFKCWREGVSFEQKFLEVLEDMATVQSQMEYWMNKINECEIVFLAARGLEDILEVRNAMEKFNEYQERCKQCKAIYHEVYDKAFTED